jgi:hypothetical protein
MALSVAESRDEWRDCSEKLDVIFQALVDIDKNPRATPAEKFERAEIWIEQASGQISSLRVNLSNDSLPRFEQSLRTRMKTFWDIDQARRDEIAAINTRPRESSAGRVATIRS